MLDSPNASTGTNAHRVFENVINIDGGSSIEPVGGTPIQGIRVRGSQRYLYILTDQVTVNSDSADGYEANHAWGIWYTLNSSGSSANCIDVKIYSNLFKALGDGTGLECVAGTFSGVTRSHQVEVYDNTFVSNRHVVQFEGQPQHWTGDMWHDNTIVRSEGPLYNPIGINLEYLASGEHNVTMRNPTFVNSTSTDVVLAGPNRYLNYEGTIIENAEPEPDEPPPVAAPSIPNNTRIFVIQ